MNDFPTLFPFNISSKELISAHTLNGKISKCSCYSAIWRQFLIIFSKKSSKILDSSSWIEILTQQRSIYSKKLKNGNVNMKMKNLAIEKFGTAFLSISGSLNLVTLNKIVDVLCLITDNLIIKPRSMETYIKAMVMIIAWMYYYFESESIQNDGTPKGILLDNNYIFEDLCCCLETFLVSFSYLFDVSNEDAYKQISFMVDKIVPGSKKPLMKDIPDVLFLYQTLFTTITKRNEIPILLSIIFSQCPDISVIDYFYSYIDLSCNNAIPSENDEFSIIEIGYLYAKMISIEKDIGKIITKQ